MSLPISPIVTRDAVARQALSALPCAPTYDDPVTARRAVRARRARTVLAGALTRAAHAVAPHDA